MRHEIRDMKYETRKKQQGQIIIILLLLMLVALSIGLALTQRSVTDVNTSTQAEQSNRAFSAAEAGIEKALSSPLPIGTVIPLDNNSSAQISQSGLLPYAGSGVAIEYPKIGRETTAHFWFVDPSVVGAPVAYYNPAGATFNLYYGNASTTDLPAVEVSVVIQSGSNFYSKQYYFDSSAPRRDPPNGNLFTLTPNCNGTETIATTILGSNRQFQCLQLVGPVPNLGGSGNCGTATCKLILARVRFLYINENHSLALAPIGAGNNLPPQVQIYNATGTSGQSQKQIQAFRVKDVILPWFDFAVFSVNEIRK